MDELLSLLQINIALGILYIGLRGGRYRDKLLRSLAELIGNRAQQFREVPEYDRLAGIDDKFQKRHHAVARWVSELPADRLADMDTVTRRFATTKSPPLLYRWFRDNWDKRICFTVLTVLGIAMSWSVVSVVQLGEDALRPPFLGIMYGLIASGQVLIALHVVVGSWMVSHYSGQCDRALNYLEAETRAEVFVSERVDDDSALARFFEKRLDEPDED